MMLCNNVFESSPKGVK